MQTSRSSADHPLTARQRRFVDAYRLEACAKSAAIRAGYRPWTAAQMGYQLLQRENVRAALAANRQADDAPVTRAMVIEELRKVAFANVMDYVRVRPNGTSLDLDLSKLDRAQAAGFRELTMHESYNGKTHVTNRTVRVRMGPKVFALTRLMAFLPEEAAAPASSALQDRFSETSQPLQSHVIETSPGLHRRAGSRL